MKKTIELPNERMMTFQLMVPHPTVEGKWERRGVKKWTFQQVMKKFHPEDRPTNLLKKAELGSMIAITGPQYEGGIIRAMKRIV